MNIFKLALYGDSLACPRQGVIDSHERYIALTDIFLKNEFSGYVELRDNAVAAATLPELYNLFCKDNTYFTLPGEILIIHAGIVDCAPRPISDALRNRISKWPEFLKNKAVKYIHNNRAKLLAKKKHVKTSPEVFSSTLTRFFEQAVPNYKNVLVINICPTTDEFNTHSPGLSDNITLYNSLILNAIKKYNSEKVELIDIYKMISESKEDIFKYIVKEDGHHIRPAAHKLIADKIIEKCKLLIHSVKV